MSENKRISNILDRAKEVLGLFGHGSDKKLSEFLGQQPAKVTNWRSSDSLNLWTIIEKIPNNHLTYVLTGVKPQDDTSFYNSDDIEQSILTTHKEITDFGIGELNLDTPQVLAFFTIKALELKKKYDKPWEEVGDLIKILLEERTRELIEKHPEDVARIRKRLEDERG